MKIQLSNHFTYKRLLLFTLPSIAMMIFTSLYGVVDGLFVSNFVGATAFASINLIMPLLIILGSIGFMFGAGGSALIGKTLGEGDPERAKRYFSLFIYATLIIGVVLAALGIAFMPEMSILLGATNEMLDYCVTYGRIILIALPCFMLQFEFQAFFAVAQKPHLGLFVTLAAGFTNIILDAAFVVGLNWGVMGAAVATALSQAVGGLVPLIYFLLPNKSLLRIGKTNVDFKALWKASSNGVSELLTNVANSVVSILYNMQLMKYYGENGVAAYGVLMYVGMIFFSTFMGYSVGCAPITSYNYGAKNTDEMKNVLKKSLVIIGISSFVMVGVSIGLSYPLSSLFVGYDTELRELTLLAFRYFSFVFLLAGTSIYGSSFFTALNNGLISAIISFLRTMVFQVTAIMVLPLIFGKEGIWLSNVISDIAAFIATIIFLVVYRKKYHY